MENLIFHFFVMKGSKKPLIQRKSRCSVNILTQIFGENHETHAGDRVTFEVLLISPILNFRYLTLHQYGVEL